MTWTYQQSSGKLFRDGALVGIGYSGRDSGLNNPVAEALEGVGPIPKGEWIIGAFFDDPGGKGPIVARLTPVLFEIGLDGKPILDEDGDKITVDDFTCGRSGFMIHGDNGAGNHSASHGCIILARPYRIAIRDSKDNRFIITA
jgi:hypothetical protein